MLHTAPIGNRNLSAEYGGNGDEHMNGIIAKVNMMDMMMCMGSMCMLMCARKSDSPYFIS